jgi:hypothetical protein
VTLERSGDHPSACRAIGQLTKQAPDSKYLARGKELCPS